MSDPERGWFVRCASYEKGVEVEIDGEVPEDTHKHPEIQEAINDTIWGVLEAVVTEKP